jgi:hypothetical protein
MSRMSTVFERITLWLSLGLWVGSWGFFAFVVSRVAFQVLPGDVAGDLAGLLLGRLHWSGAGFGVLAAAMAWRLDRRGWLFYVPLALGLACAASEFWLSPAVAAVRPSTLGAASTAETGSRFSMLHGLSLGLFMAIHAASIALLVGHARLDGRVQSGRSPTSPV